MSLAFRAMQFAMEVHKDQKRKYTNAPYFGHLAEVAGIVAAAHDGHESWFSAHLQHVVAVAWLHDCMEDQAVSDEMLADKFGLRVLGGVQLLSDLDGGNRAERKAASRARLAVAPGWVQSIKCADLISNTKSIVMFDPKFAVVYLEEKRLLLDVLTKADPRLVEMARSQV
jgi:(p)ppGpp synthase/HD superfamily hydrolase